MTTPEIIGIIVAAATRAGVDPDLACAIAKVESSYNPWAIRFEPKWSYPYDVAACALKTGVTAETEGTLQACSWGLMQIMGAVAREMGFDETMPALCDPDRAVLYGCLHLKRFLTRYAGDEPSAIAAYNAGSARKGPDGRFVNQDYVDRVTRELATIRRFNPQK